MRTLRQRHIERVRVAHVAELLRFDSMHLVVLGVGDSGVMRHDMPPHVVDLRVCSRATFARVTHFDGHGRFGAALKQFGGLDEREAKDRRAVDTHETLAHSGNTRNLRSTAQETRVRAQFRTSELDSVCAAL